MQLAKKKTATKQTEVGVIPTDWEVHQVSELVRSGPKNGYSGRSGLEAGGTATLSLSATTSGKLILNAETVKYLEATIPPESDLFLKPDDVLVQRSNTIELVGTTAVFTGPESTYIYPDLMMRLRFRNRVLAQWFWRYANSSAGRSYFRSVAAGSTGSMPKLSGDKLRDMPIPLPPTLAEQEAIASALSDVDGLTDSLEKLTAKKRQIKHGTMQGLLTGKRRLPGFSAKWETKKVREVIFKHFCGPSPTCEERNIENVEEWGVLKTTAITWENGWDWKKHKVLPKVFWNNPDIELRVGDVVVTKAGPRHRVGVSTWVDEVPKQIVVSGKMIGLRPDPSKANAMMLAAAIASRNTQRYLDQRTTGMAESQVNFENTALLETPIQLPNIEEQTAIASILSDMDLEIAALESKLAKARQVTQGIMQELLTGRTRLI